MDLRKGPWLVANAASGSNSEDDVRSLVAALGAVGAAPSRVTDISSEPAPLPGQLGDVDLVILYAGDGTVNSVVNGLEGWNGNVLILPGGTANLMAHALHGERSAAEIVAAIGSLRRVRRNGIRASCGTALIEMLAGPGAKWSDVREEMREGDLTDIAGSALEAARESIAGSRVAITRPPLGRSEGYAGVRLEPTDAGMAVTGYGAQGIADTIRQGVALLRRDFREGPHDELGHHRSLVCTSLVGEPIDLMIDGEHVVGRQQETFSLAPLVVNLLSSMND